MFVPMSYIANSTALFSTETIVSLTRRKGGGGHGGGGGRGGGSKGGSGGKSSSKGSSSSGSSTSRSVSLGSSAGRSKTASSYAFGGGARFSLPSTSPFAGRSAGGGTRLDIYGNSRYGSGYPYGAYGSYVDGRPFPYVFWPVPIAPDYYGDNEYAPYNATQRPGGNISFAVVQYSANATETYRILGDNSSVTAAMDALIENCSVANSTTELFIPSPETYPLPVQIIQWYRASSFALSLDDYNNSAASIANMPPSNSSPPLPLSADSPLPVGLNATFLACINATIGASLLLVDPLPPRFTPDQIFGLFLAGVICLLLFGLLCYGVFLVLKSWWTRYSPSISKSQGPRAITSPTDFLKG